MAFTKFAPLMNVEYTLRVASLEGTPKQSQFGKDQVLLRVDVLAPADKAMSDAAWYSYPWIVQRLQKAGVRANEPFSFCTAQTTNGKSDLRIVANGGARHETGAAPPSSWDDLDAETDLSRDLRDSVAVVQQRQAAPAVVPMPARPAPAAPGPTVHTLASQGMAGCIIAAIDANASAEAYASKKGIAYKASPDVIQAYACTLFIQLSKTGSGLNAMAPNAEQQSLVNGGTKWVQPQ